MLPTHGTQVRGNARHRCLPAVIDCAENEPPIRRFLGWPGSRDLSYAGRFPPPGEARPLRVRALGAPASRAYTQARADLNNRPDLSRCMSGPSRARSLPDIFKKKLAPIGEAEEPSPRETPPMAPERGAPPDDALLEMFSRNDSRRRSSFDTATLARAMSQRPDVEPGLDTLSEDEVQSPRSLIAVGHCSLGCLLDQVVISPSSPPSIPREIFVAPPVV
ncbi:hypothetical protein M885DRAFT_552231 [Pelagophyceae sp. CCMP2097]|nr:hypothetical protein M885DRAFT_552231 [Pelagophyceae sp. CCMP2097]